MVGFWGALRMGNSALAEEVPGSCSSVAGKSALLRQDCVSVWNSLPYEGNIREAT